jgi:hypothetical protein
MHVRLGAQLASQSAPGFTMSPLTFGTKDDWDRSACRRHSLQAGDALRCVPWCDSFCTRIVGSTVRTATQVQLSVPFYDEHEHLDPVQPEKCRNAGTGSWQRAVPASWRVPIRLDHRRPWATPHYCRRRRSRCSNLAVAAACCSIRRCNSALASLKPSATMPGSTLRT